MIPAHCPTIEIKTSSRSCDVGTFSFSNFHKINEYKELNKRLACERAQKEYAEAQKEGAINLLQRMYNRKNIILP